MSDRQAVPSRRRTRWPYLLLAYGCVGMGAIGVVVPGLPTTPFLLVAAWAATSGSERLRRRLYEHPRFGPLLRDWERQRAVPRRAKRAALLLMLLSWCLLVWLSDGPALPLITALIFAGVAAYLWTRPDSQPPQEES